MPQVEEFNLKKPSAYNYDLALLGGITAAFGLIGLPPINGVLPQVPQLLLILLSVCNGRSQFIAVTALFQVCVTFPFNTPLLQTPAAPMFVSAISQTWHCPSFVALVLRC